MQGKKQTLAVKKVIETDCRKTVREVAVSDQLLQDYCSARLNYIPRFVARIR